MLYYKEILAKRWHTTLVVYQITHGYFKFQFQLKSTKLLKY